MKWSLLLKILDVQQIFRVKDSHEVVLIVRRKAAWHVYTGFLILGKNINQQLTVRT